MTKKVKDLAVKVGTYQKGGETKNRYMNVGAVLEGADGKQFLLLDRTFNPAGCPNPENKQTVLISMFDVKGSDTHAEEAKSAAPTVPEDEIPF